MLNMKIDIVKEQIVLPPHIMSKIIGNKLNGKRLDGFIVMGFNYDGEDTVPKLHLENGYAFDKTFVMNNDVNLAMSNTAKIINAITYKHRNSLELTDLAEIYNKLAMLNDYPLLVKMTPAQTHQLTYELSKNDGHVNDDLSVFDCRDNLVDEKCKDELKKEEELTMDEKKNNEPELNKVSEDRIEDVNVKQADLDDVLIDHFSDVMVLDEDGSSSSNVRSWSEEVGEYTEILSKSRASSIDYDFEDTDAHVNDYLYHHYSRQYESLQVISDFSRKVYHRVYEYEETEFLKLISSDEGILWRSVVLKTPYVHRYGSSHVIYIVVKNVSVSAQNCGKNIQVIMQASTARALGFHHVLTDIVTFSMIHKKNYARGANREVKLKPVLFSREFGSFDECTFNDEKSSNYKLIHDLKDKISNSIINQSFEIRAAVSNVANLFAELLSKVDLAILKSKLESGYVDFCVKKNLIDYENNIGVLELDLYSMFNKIAYEPYKRSFKSCRTKCQKSLKVRNGIVYGSRLMQQSGKFVTPCGTRAENLVEYNNHACTVRKHAYGIGLPIGEIKKNKIEMTIKGSSCIVCSRLYKCKIHSVLCSFFCLDAHNFLKDEKSIVVDGFGRNIL